MEEEGQNNNKSPAGAPENIASAESAGPLNIAGNGETTGNGESAESGESAGSAGNAEKTEGIPEQECRQGRGINVAARLFIFLTVIFLIFTVVIYISIQFIMPLYFGISRRENAALTPQNFMEKLNEEIERQKALNPDVSIEEITEAFTQKYETELKEEPYKDTYAFMRVLLTMMLVFFVFGVYFYARGFARPLQKLNRAAKEIASLNFDYKYEITRSDEIGQLADSVNEMSVKLKTALTELKERNEQLSAELEHERGLDVMRKKFVSDVSHELKTPLSIISGYAEALQIGIDDRERRKDYTAVIMEEVERMTRLVRDLLSLSKYESAEYKLSTAKFDMGELLSRIAFKYEDIMAKNGITLILSVTGGEVDADSDRIEQCVNNFLNNAVSHADDAKTIYMSGAKDGGTYRVSVINSGEHIAESDIENIWTSFYRADKARTRDEGRFGIGLSIVRALLDRHGASYGVRNVTNLAAKGVSIDSGVEFYFELRT